MHTQAKIQKWGNGLALRVAGIMRDLPQFEEGTEVDVEVTEDGLIVRKHNKTTWHFPFNEAQLLKGLNPETVHADELVLPLAQELPDA